MIMKIPELSLILLVGATSSGKTTFAKRYFKDSEIVSSDYCRKMLSDDENDMEITKSAFELLHYIVNERLKNYKLTVVDATNLNKEARYGLLEIAKKNNVLSVAIILDTDEKICLERNSVRVDRNIKSGIVKTHIRKVKSAKKYLKKEGFKYIYQICSTDELENIAIERTKLWCNKKDEEGPFDIIGDVHGCFDELKMLLIKLGYNIKEIILPNGETSYKVTHEENRKVVFLGDLVDRGPKIVEVLKIVMSMVNDQIAFCVMGNHDNKTAKMLFGKNIKLKYGLEDTVSQMEGLSDETREEIRVFLDNLVSHYILDNGKLVVAHAGLKEELQGRSSGRVREFSMYGETTGETDEYGLPVRCDWAQDYRGKAIVVYGHTPQLYTQFVNNTINIDTGCVFGGKLTALRYPKREVVSVEAIKEYYKSSKPLEKSVDDRDIDIIDVNDVLGKKIINTRIFNSITIREENSMAAFEIMSRFAIDPKWLIYLPPTMSPGETSKIDNILEHPNEVFSYFESKEVEQVVCEEKHMGSRAVIVLCKDIQSAKERFRVADGKIGVCYTRTGRSFFADDKLEQDILTIFRDILNKTRFWDDFNTDWVCFDTELMPWSDKAIELLKNQYAPVGKAGMVSLDTAIKEIKESLKYEIKKEEVSINTSGQNLDLQDLLNKYENRYESINKYIHAYRQYCWDVNSIEDYKIAPFHILATELKVYSDKDNQWHMETIRKYCCNGNNLIKETKYLVVDVFNEESVNSGIKWWEDLTARGGEGMVVKPFDFIAYDNGEIIQPALKCRGREYLRIIYGPEYTLYNNLNRLKKRSCGRKRSLALREFSLGMESLERFVGKEGLYRVHECVFAVLALESEPVDPRL